MTKPQSRNSRLRGAVADSADGLLDSRQVGLLSETLGLAPAWRMPTSAYSVGMPTVVVERALYGPALVP